MPDKEPQVLKAILFADLAQFSRLTAIGELATLDLVTRCFGIFKDLCSFYHGEFVTTTGDGVIIVFNGVSNAIDYAMTVQEKLADFADEFPAAGRFRIGLHTGEVRRRDGDVFGHAVNVAARVQTHAEPGRVCVTQDVFRAARDTTRYGFHFAGRKALKNIPEMVSLYHVTPPRPRQAKPGAVLLSVSVIDGFAIQGADGEPIGVRSRKAQALIGYLALSSGFTELRGRIATLLWPDSSAADAQIALNNCMRVIGKLLDRDSVKSDIRRGNYASIAPSRMSVDVIRILDDLGEGRIDECLLRRSDWAEAILFGFEGVSSLFQVWLRVTRHNHRERAQEALEELLKRFDEGETITRHAATALLLLEPSHEGAVRALMRHHAANHNGAAALRVFKTLRDTLRERYLLEPSAETTALVANLLEPPTYSKEERPTRFRMPVVGVGPFIADTANIAAIVSGFRSELVINLSKFRELTVVDLRDGGEGIGSDFFFKADCKEVGEEIWLFVSLEEPGSRRIVWSDSYRLSLATWIHLQRQLVGRLASSLEVYLSHDKLARAMQQLPKDLGVYDAWLRGQHLLSNWSAESEDEAESLFERAMAKDPNFAPCYASLASVYNARQYIRPGSRSNPETLRRSLELAGRAVEIDPLDARNHMVVAWSAAMAKRFEQAVFHFELASKLNPNDPKIIVSAALGLAFMGRNHSATELLEHAFALTSIFLSYQWSHIATTRYLIGDYTGSVEAANMSDNVIIDTLGWKAAALRKLGQNEEALLSLDQLHQTVSKVWAGPHSPSAREVVEWFLGAFPMRGERERLDLAMLLRSDP